MMNSYHLTIVSKWLNLASHLKSCFVSFRLFQQSNIKARAYSFLDSGYVGLWECGRVVDVSFLLPDEVSHLVDSEKSQKVKRKRCVECVVIVILGILCIDKVFFMANSGHLDGNEDRRNSYTQKGKPEPTVTAALVLATDRSLFI